MPIYRGYDVIDKKRYGWYRYGHRGAKYYYLIGNIPSQDRAYQLAFIQMQAVHARQNRA